MNLPQISLSDIEPHLAALQRLIDAGWSVCINHVETRWHVGLAHTTLGRCEVVLHDGGQTSSWDGDARNVHAQSRSLNVALGDAIKQAGEVAL